MNLLLKQFQYGPLQIIISYIHYIDIFRDYNKLICKGFKKAIEYNFLYRNFGIEQKETYVDMFDLDCSDNPIFINYNEKNSKGQCIFFIGLNPW